MEIFLKNSKTIISILIISAISFGVINASTTDSKNSKFDRNDPKNDTIQEIEEKAQQLMELYINFLNNFPVNDMAIILSNVIYSEDDFDDIMYSTLNSEIFAGIVRYLKAYDNKSKAFGEFAKKFTEHPAAKVATAATEAFAKELKSLESLDIDVITKAKILLDSKLIDGVNKIHRLAGKIISMDDEFRTFLKYLIDHHEPMIEALSQFIDEIKKNKLLQDIENLETFKIIKNIAEKRRNMIKKFGELGRFSYKLDGQLPRDFFEKFLMELINELVDDFSALLNNERLVDFLVYLDEGELPKVLKAAWQKASFEEKDSFVRDEL